jgi:hypothetical protein
MNASTLAAAQLSVNAPRMPSLTPVALATSGYLLVFGGALWWLLGADPTDAIWCFGPVALMGALGATSQTDRRQYVARLFAALLFFPIGLLMWSISHPQSGLWMVAFGLIHVAGILGLLVWLAGYTTRIGAVPTVAFVGQDALGRRLESLAASLEGVAASREANSAVWVIEAAEGEERIHRVTVDVDERGRTVQVREFVGASGAAPRDADERNMRPLGKRLHDPKRPNAQAVWSRTWQSTMIEPERLSRTVLEFRRDHVEHELQGRTLPDADALVTLLAALVTRSGYDWQPQLLPKRRATIHAQAIR